jgi:hypothetical protein
MLTGVRRVLESLIHSLASDFLTTGGNSVKASHSLNSAGFRFSTRLEAEAIGFEPT